MRPVLRLLTILFTYRRGNTVVATLLSMVVISINTFFVVETVGSLHLGWAAFTAVVIVAILYLLFCVYLVIHMAVSLGTTSLTQYDFVGKYVLGDEQRRFTNDPVSYSR